MMKRHMTPRPHDTDMAIYVAVAHELAEAIGSEVNVPPLADAVRQIADALATDREAVVVGHELSRRWGLDDDLAALFEDVPALMHSSHREAVAHWVAKEQVTLPLPISTRVTTPRGHGTIIGHDRALARYLVSVDALNLVLGGSHIGVYIESEQLAPE